MARSGNSVLGHFNGTLGTIVGTTWKGIPIVKSRPARRKNRNFSEAQLDQQAKLKTVVEHLQSMAGVLKHSFTNVGAERTAFNSAVSDTLTNALTGVYPSYGIDWSKLQVSRGRLLPAQTSNAAVNGSNIQFTWSTEVVTSEVNPLDKVILVVYCPEVRLCFYDMVTYSRSAGTGQVNAGYFSGKMVHTYIGFITSKGDKSSISKYTGEFMVV